MSRACAVAHIHCRSKGRTGFATGSSCTSAYCANMFSTVNAHDWCSHRWRHFRWNKLNSPLRSDDIILLCSLQVLVAFVTWKACRVTRMEADLISQRQTLKTGVAKVRLLFTVHKLDATARASMWVDDTITSYPSCDASMCRQRRLGHHQQHSIHFRMTYNRDSICLKMTHDRDITRHSRFSSN